MHTTRRTFASGSGIGTRLAGCRRTAGASVHESQDVDRSVRAGSLYDVEGISPRRKAFNRIVVMALDEASSGMRRHWLPLFNATLGLLVAGAFAPPSLFALGAPAAGRRVFSAYHLVCAQIPSHSYFLFGYQLALCARNLAIYCSLFVGSLAYRSVRAWLPPLDWRLWAVTMMPMAWDGGTQLFGWRESTWELRTLTGVIFGLGICWFILPRIERAVHTATHSTLPSSLQGLWTSQRANRREEVG